MVSYSLDDNSRITGVTETKDNKANEIITSVSYNTNGTVASINYANGILTSKEYDVKGTLSSLNIGDLKQFSYTRDSVGNITAINDLIDSTKNKTYSYDALYRLTQAIGPWGTISYNYDPLGNRLAENSTSGTTDYSYTANKLTSSTGAKAFSFSYDNNGNTTVENNRQYIYNQNQRLIKAVENGSTLGEYSYNGNGQRVKKVATDRTTYFIYDQSGNLIEEADENGNINSDYIYLGSIPIARVDEWWEGMDLPDAPTGVVVTPGDTQLTVSWNPNTDTDAVTDTGIGIDGYKVYWGTESGNYTDSVDVGETTSYTITGLTNGTTYYVVVKAYADIKETYYYHTDHLGTPILMTNKNGDIVWEKESLPFGEEYSITGSVTNNLGFPGQYFDNETGIYYNWHRYYKTDIGRYMSFDPILRGYYSTLPSSCNKNSFKPPLTKPLKLNPFSYAMANPLVNVDPQGLACGPGVLGDLIIPDDWPSYSFEGCCQEHDDCYGCLGKQSGFTKSECDEGFCNCMHKQCENLDGDSRRSCEGNAQLYCDFVKNHGDSSFNKARKCCS